VIREYVGGGTTGEQAAQEDTQRRAERDADRAILRAERERVGAIDAALMDLHRTTDVLTRGHLLIAGFERHKRQWRRRHDDTSEDGGGRR
jgi:hypothetical protein